MTYSNTYDIADILAMIYDFLGTGGVMIVSLASLLVFIGLFVIVKRWLQKKKMIK